MAEEDRKDASTKPQAPAAEATPSHLPEPRPKGVHALSETAIVARRIPSQVDPTESKVVEEGTFQKREHETPDVKAIFADLDSAEEPVASAPVVSHQPIPQFGDGDEVLFESGAEAVSATIRENDDETPVAPAADPSLPFLGGATAQEVASPFTVVTEPATETEQQGFLVQELHPDYPFNEDGTPKDKPLNDIIEAIQPEVKEQTPATFYNETQIGLHRGMINFIGTIESVKTLLDENNINSGFFKFEERENSEGINVISVSVKNPNLIDPLKTADHEALLTFVRTEKSANLPQHLNHEVETNEPVKFGALDISVNLSGKVFLNFTGTRAELQAYITENNFNEGDYEYKNREVTRAVDGQKETIQVITASTLLPESTNEEVLNRYRAFIKFVSDQLPKDKILQPIPVKYLTARSAEEEKTQTPEPQEKSAKPEFVPYLTRFQNWRKERAATPTAIAKKQLADQKAIERWENRRYHSIWTPLYDLKDIIVEKTKDKFDSWSDKAQENASKPNLFQKLSKVDFKSFFTDPNYRSPFVEALDERARAKKQAFDNKPEAIEKPKTGLAKWFDNLSLKAQADAEKTPLLDSNQQKRLGRGLAISGALVALAVPTLRFAGEKLFPNEPNATTPTAEVQTAVPTVTEVKVQTPNEIDTLRSNGATIVDGLRDTKYAINDGEIIKFSTSGKETITIDAYLSDVKIAVTVDKKVAEQMLERPAASREILPAQAAKLADWLEKNIAQFDKAAEQSKTR